MMCMKETQVLNKHTFPSILLFVKEVCVGTLNPFRPFDPLACLFVFRVLKASLEFIIFLPLPSKY